MVSFLVDENSFFRMDDQSSRRKIEIARILLDNYTQRLLGNFITISDSKIRIRKIEKVKFEEG